MRRKVQVARCPKCKAVVLAGLDADLAALPAHAAPERLSRLGEALALAEGRRTYEMASGQYLDTRDRDGIIRNRPADKHHVHAEHKCNSPIPRNWCAPIPKRPSPQKYLTDWTPAPALPGRGQRTTDPEIARATALLAEMLGATVVREHPTYGEAS